jgi:peroxin-12
VDLRRLGADDFVSVRTINVIFVSHIDDYLPHKRLLNGVAKSSSPKPPPGVRSIVVRFLLSSPRLLLDSLKVLLPTAIFFIKFLEWWYSPSSPARSLATSPLGPAVPPPKLLPPHPRGIQVDKTKYGQCPICRGPINNATALPSGYVFCYKCVYNHVEKHGRCPVTLLPAKAWQLRKILV